jgi:hypothetical protein
VSRDEALLKLLALEPATRQQLVQDTGWGIVGTQEVLDRLLQQKRIGTQPITNQHELLFCLPDQATALKAKPDAPNHRALLPQIPVACRVQTSPQPRAC